MPHQFNAHGMTMLVYAGTLGIFMSTACHSTRTIAIATAPVDMVADTSIKKKLLSRIYHLYDTTVKGVRQTMYKLTDYDLDQCLQIIEAYTVQINSTICPSVKDDYMRARKVVVNYIRNRWPNISA